MKKVCVIGHFADGKNLLNGQTVKTKILTNELIRRFGKNNVICIDTHGGYIAIIRCFFKTAFALKQCENIIMLPARNGVRFFAPVLVFWNSIFRRKLHYDVVGGWLPSILDGNKWLQALLKKFNGIYVETISMKTALDSLGFNNVTVIPNCKELDVLKNDALVYTNDAPFKLCTFSRVMKEKGIGEAIEAVDAVNKACDKIVFELDIYGQVEADQVQWFEELKKVFSEYIHYKGQIPFNQSTDVLKNYFALLFPTYYEGEGFAGTIIDAMAAGVPVIASDWKYNSEIIKQGVTGKLFKTHDNLELQKILKDIVEDPKEFLLMKANCIDCAKNFLPVEALLPLENNL